MVNRITLGIVANGRAREALVQRKEEIDDQLPEAIIAEMKGVFDRLGLPESPVHIEADGRYSNGVRIYLGEAGKGFDASYGSTEIRQARVMGALATAAQIAGQQRGWCWDYQTGSLVFAEAADLAVAVRTVAAAHPAQVDGKFQHLINAGPKAGYEIPARM